MRHLLVRPVSLLSASLVLLGAARGQGAVSMEGLWELTVSTSTTAAGGTTSKSKTKVAVPFGDFGADALVLAAFPLGDGRTLPGATGTRFAGAFAARAEGLSLAASVSASGGEAKSFKGTGIFTTPRAITFLKIKGKRVAGSPPSALLPLFAEDFESGLDPYRETDDAGASAETLWHAEAFCDVSVSGIPVPAPFGTTAAAYNRGDQVPPAYTYDTGPAANEGALEGPAVEVPAAAPGIRVHFDVLRNTEGGSIFDQTFFEAREVGCASWIPILRVLDDNVGCGSKPVTVTIGPADAVLNSFVGKKFLHRFRFDTVDETYNAYLGWYVDNVAIEVVNP